MSSDCKHFSLETTGAFPRLLLDYLNRESSLKTFYNEYPDLAGFKNLIEKRSFTQHKRDTLVNALEEQYEHIKNPPNLKVLQDHNTFTVTTGHQLNIFTGPLYIPYKIVSTINLAQRLKEAFPSYNFIPVYWMASEDHDLEEIQVFRAFGQKRKWETPQCGAVGRMNTDGLEEMATELGPLATLFANAYKKNKTLSNAVRHYMHELFGIYGLVTLDADHKALKTLFNEVMLDDLTQHSAFKKAQESTKLIAEMGYKTPVNAREINFFYLKDDLRERIEKDGEVYKIVDTDISFSKEEMMDLVQNEPQCLSPNVILRPLYEETILPNLAYFGGPSEIPYWLQLKGIFDHFKIDFPALVPRNFGMLVGHKEQSLIEKLGLKDEDVFKPIHEVQKLWVTANSSNPLSTKEAATEVKAAFSKLKKQVERVDSTLCHTSEAFETKTLSLIDSLEKKILRAEKRNHQDSLRQITKLKNTLFPDGGLQERKDNIMDIWSNDPDFIERVLKTFDPLCFEFYWMEG